MVKSKEVELRKWLGTRKDFTEEEKGALKCQTYKEFAQYWSKVADKEQQDLDKRHQRGWAKWSHGYQSFGSAVMGFMKDWEPIINIVKGFGGAYGDMAVGTISVVFVVSFFRTFASIKPVDLQGRSRRTRMLQKGIFLPHLPASKIE